MTDCGDKTFVVPNTSDPRFYRCVPVGLKRFDPEKGCVTEAPRPLTCVSVRIGTGEFGCNNSVRYPDGTVGFVSFNNTGCPLFDLPPGTSEEPPGPGSPDYSFCEAP